MAVSGKGTASQSGKKMSLSLYILLCCMQCFSDHLGEKVIHAHGAKMSPRKIKMQEKRNEVNNTSSCGLCHHDDGHKARIWHPVCQELGLLLHHCRLGIGKEEAAAQRGTLSTSLLGARQRAKHFTA